MVMIIIGPPAVATPAVELPDLRSNFASVVLRVEYRDSIGSQSDCPSQETSLDTGRRASGHGKKWDAPRVGSRITLRNGYLLLPVGDPDHHGVGGHSGALNIKKALVPANRYVRGKALENTRLKGAVGAAGCCCLGCRGPACLRQMHPVNSQFWGTPGVQHVRGGVAAKKQKGRGSNCCCRVLNGFPPLARAHMCKMW